LEFECPSCRLICQCAACRKRQQLAEMAGAGNSGQQDSGEVEEKTDGGQVEEEEVELTVGRLDSDMMVDDSAINEAILDDSTAVASPSMCTTSDESETSLGSAEA